MMNATATSSMHTAERSKHQETGESVDDPLVGKGKEGSNRRTGTGPGRGPIAQGQTASVTAPAPSQSNASYPSHSPSSAIVQPQHWSVFYPCGIEVQPPPALHYLHIGTWSTTPPCHDYYQHRHSRKLYNVGGGPSASAAAPIDPPGQKVLWLHTAQPRDRFVFLVAPVESARPKSLLVTFWSLIYGTPPAFAFTGGSLAWTRSGKLKASLQAKKGAGAKSQPTNGAGDGKKGKGYGWNSVVGKIFPSWRRTENSNKSPTYTSKESSRNGSFSTQGAPLAGHGTSGSRTSSPRRGDSDDEGRGLTAPVSVEGVEAVEVLHDDITAIDYNCSLTTQRLALEAQVVTTLWFPSKTAALEHYGVSPSTVIFLPSLPPAGLEVQQELAAQADDRRGKLGVEVGPSTSNRLLPLPLSHVQLNRTLSRSGFPLPADGSKAADSRLASAPNSSFDGHRPAVPLTPVAARQLASGHARHPPITHGTTLLMMTRKPSQISPILTGKSAPTSHVVSPDQQPLQRGATIGDGGGFSFDCTIRGQIELPSLPNSDGTVAAESSTAAKAKSGTTSFTPPLAAASDKSRNTNSPIPPLQLPDAVNITHTGTTDSNSTAADGSSAATVTTKSGDTLESFSARGGRGSSPSPCRTSASVGFMDDDPAPMGTNGENDADGAPTEAVLKKRVRPGSFAAKRLKRRGGAASQSQSQLRGTPKSEVPTTPLDSTPNSIRPTFRDSGRLSSKDNLLGRHEEEADMDDGNSSRQISSLGAEEEVGQPRSRILDGTDEGQVGSPTKTPSRTTPLQGAAASGVEWQYHQWGTVIIAADDEDSDDESDGQGAGMGLRAGSESSRQSENDASPLTGEKTPQGSPNRERGPTKVSDGYWDSFGSEPPQHGTTPHLGSSGNLSASQHKDKMKPIVEVHKRRIINTIVTVYSQDPHFNAVLREVLLPEKGNVAFTKDAQSQRRLLALYEAGMPSWTVFVARKGLMPYRRWIRLVVVFIYNLWPVIALGVGLYDLYKHMPYFKDWLAETFHPFTEWIDKHFTIVVSMWIGYFVSAGFNVLLGVYGMVKVFISLFTVILQPFASLLAVLAMLKYPIVALWSFVSIAGSGLYSIFNAFGLIVNTLLMPLRLIGTLFSIMFQYAPGGAAALQATAQSTSTFVQTWRNWLYFWDKVLRPVKNVLKALYDGVVHLGVAIAKREMSLRRWYLGVLSSAYAMLDRQATGTVDMLRENLKILRVARPPSSVLLLFAFALLWCTVGELLLDALRWLLTYIAGVGLVGGGSDSDPTLSLMNGAEDLALAAGIQSMA